MGTRGNRRTLVLLVALLVAEARLVDRAGLEPGPEPDAARRYPVELSREDLAAALVRPADRDPFVDAYVRWQLTGYGEPDPATLSDRLFDELLRRVPRPIENPKAERGLIARLERAAAGGPMAGGALDRLRRTTAELDERVTRARRLNAAADRFAAWVEASLADHPLRRRRWRIARLAVTAAAGWPVTRLKGALTTDLAGASLTEADRLTLASDLAPIRDLERRIVDQVTFMADGSVRVSFRRSRIGSDDVDRWVARTMDE